MTVAEMIKQTRTNSNMTQEEYGAKLGVSRQTVSSWENGRSMPDLQMLIDICNIYHISLDKLLNEDNTFVNKIDFYGRIAKILKSISICVFIGIVLFGIAFFRWKIIATDKNETFATNAKEWGFTLEGGSYFLEEQGVLYQLPNQKLPFLEKDFFVKNSFAYFKIGDTEINIAVYDEQDIVNITFNHNRSMEGKWTEVGELDIFESTLNEKEKDLLNRNEREIKEVSEQLLEIHNSVYS
ncbi:MAG: helix-turn-helix transcriptional regulator [Bacillota bacterium]|nr:helix-turn-helix transcriptional regulator [Bacillota bacterium]